MNSTTYQIFDGDDQTFELVVTSNANIRKVCQVLTQAAHLSFEERVYYAQQGDIPPESIDAGGRASYTFENRYDAATVWPALAERLFYDFPALTGIGNDGPAYILGEPGRKLNDRLIRSEVKRARDAFFLAFGVNPFEVSSLFDWLSSGLTPETISQIMNPADLPDATPAPGATPPTSPAGTTSSGPDTPSGAESSA